MNKLLKQSKIRFALALALLPSTFPALSQQLYRCGNTYSQTPCGGDAKEIKVQVSPACQEEHTRYSEACIQHRMRELDKVTTPAVSPDGKKAALQVEAAKKLPPPHPDVVEENLRKCESKILRSLKDPESAKISEGRRAGPSLDYVKGEMRTYAAVAYHFKVNAKNSYGGYTGNKLFSCVMDLEEKTILRVNEIGPYPE